MGMKKKSVATITIIPDSPATKAHFRCLAGNHHDAITSAKEKKAYMGVATLKKFPWMPPYGH
jgi:hypothetical protein